MLARQDSAVARDIDSIQHSHPSIYTVATEKAVRDFSAASDIRSSGPQSAISSTQAPTNSEPATSYPSSNRVSSMTSIDSNIYRQWPGYRVFSPNLDWKSASSVAQVTGLATAYFSNRESEGTQ